ncbi:MAG: bile acid:sodium symporter family protein [Planctomycetota bacterium]|nr:MAG: bile acid:sodium symporter family protein [Planctomycetota bacterium]
MKLLDRLANAFPVWVLLACGLALLWPEMFSWFRGNAIVVGLAVIMLGMGLTLSIDDFRRVASRPGAVVAGCIGQFLIMPLAGWGVATALGLETPFAVGLILVACCPGGTASNVVTYLARADVALSVIMTTCTTLAAVVLTPLLTKFLAGRLIEVDALGLFLSTLQVVVLPVVGGMAVNRWLPGVVACVLPGAPLVSVITIALVCASVIGQNAPAVRSAGPRLLVAVGLLHAIGFAVGYLWARLFGYDRTISRTISIEVGMQNSGLGVVLAQRHFPAEPLTAVPCAISSVVHSCIGSLLAGWWRLRPTPAADSQPAPPHSHANEGTDARNP